MCANLADTNTPLLRFVSDTSYDMALDSIMKSYLDNSREWMDTVEDIRRDEIINNSGSVSPIKSSDNFNDNLHFIPNAFGGYHVFNHSSLLNLNNVLIKQSTSNTSDNGGGAQCTSTPISKTTSLRTPVHINNI